MRTAPLLLLALLAACDSADAPADAPADTASVDSIAAPVPAPTRPALDPVLAQWLTRVDSTVFVRWGACPFECCVYRDWVAEAPVVVRAEPSSSARVLATLAVGDRFEADTGFVHITSPQLVIVTGTVEAYRIRPRPDGGEPDSLGVGDTVLVLNYQGEGHYVLTDGTETYSAGQFWPGEDGYEPYGGARGRTIGRHEAEWWAHVRTSAGVEGWIDAYASELGNVDACGVPV